MTRSLSGRLLLGLIGLVVAGLLVSDVATYLALQGFLLDRVDQQLLDGRQLARLALDPGLGPGGPPRAPPVLSGYVEVRLADGGFQCQWVGLGSSSGCSPAPSLPNPLPPGTDQNPAVFSAPGTGGVSRFEVVDYTERDGDVVVYAIPLTEVQTTLDDLLLLEGAISAAVLAILALLAWWIIRIGLRPLERMGATAQAIAAGDLSRRVEPATDRTEIGRLGLALNGMLSQIETAFGERTRSEQRLRRFLADASHELRTPLTSIRGYAELLRRGAAQPAQDADLARRRIEQEAVRMSVMVDDLLLLARLDQGRPLERAPVDLRAIARDAVADAGAVASQRSVTLAANGPVVVTGDELRLRQVLGNLLRNAVVHTPPGTPIEVSVGAGAGHALVTVADHGPGLSPEVAARVFEPFYRADVGRSRDRGGSGLGLSIVAAVVAAHRGHVEVHETAGGGATFSVDLPLEGTRDLPANSEDAPIGR